VLRIRDVYPGSDFFHPGSRIRTKEFKYFVGRFCPSPNPDSDPSEFRIRNNDFNHGTDPDPSIIAQKIQDKLLVNDMDPDPYNKQKNLKLEEKPRFQLFDHVRKQQDPEQDPDP
jgi:hypothetical protein